MNRPNNHDRSASNAGAAIDRQQAWSLMFYAVAAFTAIMGGIGRQIIRQREDAFCRRQDDSLN